MIGVLVLAAALDAGGTVVVTATRDERPLHEQAGNTALIAGDEIALVGHTHASEIIGRAPGAWVTRGSSQEHLTAIRSPILTGPGACGAFLFMEDGLAARAAGFCNVNGLFELNTEQARAIEVVRGPGSALYGSNALHGLVNVIMQRPGDPLTTRADAGPYGFGRLAVATGDAATWRVDAHVGRDGGWRDGSGYDQYKLNWRHHADAFEWSFAATDLHQDTAAFVVGEDAFRDRAVARSNPTPDAFRDAENQRASLMWSTQAGDWAVTLRPYARRARMRFLQHFIPGDPEESNGHTSAGLQAAMRRDAPDGSLWLVGSDLEVTRGHVEQFQAEPLTDASDFLNETRPQGRHYDFTVDAVTVAAFAQAEQVLAGRWRSSTGLRVEHTRYDYDNRMAAGNLRDDGTPCGLGGCHYNRPADRRDSFTAVTPKAGISYRVGEDASAYAAMTRGFRAPQVNELYRLQRGQDVADLDMERLDSAELGLRGRAGRTHYDLALFTMRKRSVVFQDSAGFAVSDGRTRHRGLEVSLLQPLGPAFDFALSATVARHRYDFDREIAGGDTIRRGDEVDTAPRHLASARLGWRPVTGHRVELEAVRVGAHWLDAANEHRYHGHTLLNLRGTHALRGAWRFGWRLTNLADRRYAERADFAFGDYRYFPGPPRSLFVSVGTEY